MYMYIFIYIGIKAWLNIHQELIYVDCRLLCVYYMCVYRCWGANDELNLRLEHINEDTTFSLIKQPILC